MLELTLDELMALEDALTLALVRDDFPNERAMLVALQGRITDGITTLEQAGV